MRLEQLQFDGPVVPHVRAAAEGLGLQIVELSGGPGGPLLVVELREPEDAYRLGVASGALLLGAATPPATPARAVRLRD